MIDQETSTAGLDARASWGVKEQAIHGELAKLVSLSAEETSALAMLHEAASGAARAMTEAFYERLLAHENTREFLDGVDLGRMHAQTGQWFTELFGGCYGPEYVERRLHIGRVHARIGLPVRYPLAMLDIVLEHGTRVAAGSGRPELTQAAFRKVMALDIAIFNQAYEDNQLKHLVEMVGGERLARRLLMGMS